MIDNYQREFDSKDVNFNSHGISLKRNKFTYATIDYNSIEEIRIINGYLLKNRLIVLLGAFCIIWIGYSVINTGLTILLKQDSSSYEWLNHFFNKGSLVAIWGPLLLIIMGIMAIYNTFKKSYIAKIKLTNKTYNPRIKEIEVRHEIDLLIEFLKEKNIKIYKEST